MGREGRTDKSRHSFYDNEGHGRGGLGNSAMLAPPEAQGEVPIGIANTEAVVSSSARVSVAKHRLERHGKAIG